MFIGDLPYLETKHLSDLLDQNNKFEELAAHMNYDTATIQSLHLLFRRDRSPTQQLLNLWSQQDHEVHELFILLSRMKHYEAMKIIQNFVEPKYHILFNPPTQLKISTPVQVKPQNTEITWEDNNLRPQSDQKHNVNERLLNIPYPRPTVNTGSRAVVSEQTVIEKAGALPHIPYEELQNATNNWDSNFILGKGGFGTVFKGKWKETDVAIKRIEQKQESAQSRMEQISQSITELQCLNAYRHDNILPLYGYSVMGPQPCLVYQFMSGNSLEYRLRSRNNDKILNWPTRLNVAIGTAKGLQFLHRIGEKPLIHGDIKSANILLDEYDKPRIGDFGLAREGPQSNYIRIDKIHGTRPYVPDEFLRSNKFSTKVDTYSFGIVLFEIITALPAQLSAQYEKKFLKNFIVDMVPEAKEDIELRNEHLEKVLQFKDPKVKEGECYFYALLKIGLKCVKDRPKDRPEMVQVYKLLEEQQQKINI